MVFITALAVYLSICFSKIRITFDYVPPRCVSSRNSVKNVSIHYEKEDRSKKILLVSYAPSS